MERTTLQMIIDALKFLWPYLAGLWGLGLAFQVLMITNRKPGVKLFDQRLMYNPFNVQFYGDEYLTLAGLRWRNLSWICYGFFAAVLGLLLGTYYYIKHIAV